MFRNHLIKEKTNEAVFDLIYYNSDKQFTKLNNE